MAPRRIEAILLNIASHNQCALRVWRMLQCTVRVWRQVSILPQAAMTVRVAGGGGSTTTSNRLQGLQEAANTAQEAFSMVR